MSGHSKWSTIKRKKGAKDAQRGKLFSKLVKEIIVAAKMGGGDPSANARLRTAVTTARSNSLPAENIERAIKKGTGDLEGASYEEVTYEGYGPGGVAILASALTDNRNRTVADIRHIFDKNGGSIGTSGCVAWMFKKRGVLNVAKSAVDEEKLMEVALEAGAEDVFESDEGFEIATTPENFDAVSEALEKAGIPTENAEVAMVPDTTVSITGKEAEQVLRLLDMLDDHDDLQSVASNADIPPEEMERLSA